MKNDESGIDHHRAVKKPAASGREAGYDEKTAVASVSW
jgi:hypothetical protein